MGSFGYLAVRVERLSSHKKEVDIFPCLVITLELEIVIAPRRPLLFQFHGLSVA